MTDQAAAPPAASRGMRTFYTIWLGQLISLLGTQLTFFGLSVFIVQQTGRATPFALTILFANLPGVLLAPLAGIVIDRVPRRLVMILSDSGSALVTLGGALLLFGGRLEVWHVYVMAALSSTFGAFQEPAYMASVTMLVPKEHYGRASGLVQMAQAVSQLIAPLAAGALYVVIGLRGLILIDFVTYFFALGALLIVSVPDPVRSDRVAAGWSPSALLADVSFGWRYITARRGLLAMLIYFALVNFLANGAGVLGPPMILKSESPAVLGLVQAVAGVGMLGGSLIMSAWGGPKGDRNMLAIYGAIALFGVGFFVFGLRPSPWFYGLGFALVLFALPLGSGNSQAIWQRKVAAEVQGRVFSTRIMISRSIMPVAYLLAGPLADGVFEPAMQPGGVLAPVFGPILDVGEGRGIGLFFIVSGVLIWLATAAAYAYRPMREVERSLPDAAEPPAEAERPAETSDASAPLPGAVPAGTTEV